MPNINDQLVELLTLQDQITHLNELGPIGRGGELRKLQAERDRLRGAIIEQHRALLAACEFALDWLNNAPIDYANGVVHQGTDEGNILGWNGHSEITKRLAAALDNESHDSTTDVLF